MYYKRVSESLSSDSFGDDTERTADRSHSNDSAFLLANNEERRPGLYVSRRSDLDIFLVRVYAYYAHGGMKAFCAHHVTSMLRIALAVAMFVFFSSCVHYGELMAALRSNEQPSDHVALSRFVSFEAGGLAWWTYAPLAACAFYVLTTLVVAVREIAAMVHVRDFYEFELGLRKLDGVEWSVVAERLTRQPELARAGLGRTSVEVVSRIMRSENYLISLASFGVLRCGGRGWLAALLRGSGLTDASGGSCVSDSGFSLNPARAEDGQLRHALGRNIDGSQRSVGDHRQRRCSERRSTKGDKIGGKGGIGRKEARGKKGIPSVGEAGFCGANDCSRGNDTGGNGTRGNGARSNGSEGGAGNETDNRKPTLANEDCVRRSRIRHSSQLLASERGTEPADDSFQLKESRAACSSAVGDRLCFTKSIEWALQRTLLSFCFPSDATLRPELVKLIARRQKERVRREAAASVLLREKERTRERAWKSECKQGATERGARRQTHFHEEDFYFEHEPPFTSSSARPYHAAGGVGGGGGGVGGGDSDAEYKKTQTRRQPKAKTRNRAVRVAEDENRVVLQRLGVQLTMRFRALALLGLLLSPLSLFYVLVDFLTDTAPNWRTRPYQIFSARSWSKHARWLFRDYNELPHYFRRRLARSYAPAMQYTLNFSSATLAVVARFLMFSASTFLIALLVIGFIYDDVALTRIEILLGRSGLWWLGVTSAALTVLNSLVPKEDDVFEPHVNLKAFSLHTHYLPRHWMGAAAASSRVRREVFALFEYRWILFAREILSLLLAPYIMWSALPRLSERLLAFVLDNTVYEPGVGYVCRYSTLRRLYGDDVFMRSNFGGASDECSGYGDDDNDNDKNGDSGTDNGESRAANSRRCGEFAENAPHDHRDASDGNLAHFNATEETNPGRLLRRGSAPLRAENLEQNGKLESSILNFCGHYADVRRMNTERASLFYSCSNEISGRAGSRCTAAEWRAPGRDDECNAESVRRTRDSAVQETPDATNALGTSERRGLRNPPCRAAPEFRPIDFVSDDKIATMIQDVLERAATAAGNNGETLDDDEL